MGLVFESSEESESRDMEEELREELREELEELSEALESMPDDLVERERSESVVSEEDPSVSMARIASSS